MVNITINGKSIACEQSMTILEAARQNNIYIPSLCEMESIHRIGSCRICVVEVEGARNLQASCVVKVREGMVIKTNSARVRKARKVTYELLVSDHPKDCLSCSRNRRCQLQELGEILGVDETRLEGELSPRLYDESPSITRDSSKCVLCRRCVVACNDIQAVGAIGSQNRGFNTVISPALGLPLESVDCAMCGQCTVVCPTAALTETDGMEMVWTALNDSTKRVVVQVAPAVRAALGEEFELPSGTLVTGKMVSALHELGFDDVFDTNFAADLTIIEEGTELLQRLQAALTGGQAVLPMLTSCSPGWIKHIEHAFPTELDHLSTCKSPHTMMGAVVKSFYAEKIGVDPKDIYMVSVMPCTAKKYEIQRPEMQNGGNANVDAVITTRELARMIRTMGIDFVNLPDGSFDAPLGFSTGAADIFGVTGGVMEAALRTVYELVTGREVPLENLHLAPIVGLDNIKEAEFTFENVLPDYGFLEGVTAKIAVTSGLQYADVLMRQVEEGTSPYHFIEVMGCPNGCINGGGQPRPTGPTVDQGARREARMQALYREDEGKAKRKSHENQDLLQLYTEFLGDAGGHLCHELLHTTYTPRGKYNELVKVRCDC